METLFAQRGGQLHARPVTADDAAFLAQLYASTRQDLLHLPVPREVIDGITRHQQQLQTLGYLASFPDAQFLLLEHLGAPVGRLVLHEADCELRIVDIAIAPAARRRGHARSVLRSIQDRAAGQSAALTLRVRKDNPNARRLYASLGFAVTGEDEVAEQMRWTPQNE
jgi:ribosomal protein S18 acetylase RimI-like enzyme